MIIINTPHNPTGTVLKAEDLKGWKTSPPARISWCSATRCMNTSSTTGSNTKAYCVPPAWGALPGYLFLRQDLPQHGLEDRLLPGARPPDGGVSKSPSVQCFRQYAHAVRPTDYLCLIRKPTSLDDFFRQKRLLSRRDEGLQAAATALRRHLFYLFDYSAISDEPDTKFAKRMTTEWGVAAIPVSAFLLKRQFGQGDTPALRQNRRPWNGQGVVKKFNTPVYPPSIKFINARLTTRLPPGWGTPGEIPVAVVVGQARRSPSMV